MQIGDERRAADARLLPFAGRAGFLAAGFAAIVSLSFIAAILIVSFILTSQMDVVAMSVDFRVFWGAAKLAVEGDPLAAHDLARLGASHATYPDAYLPWLYPPAFLLLVTPFGWLSFSPAFLLWTVLSFATIIITLRPFTGNIRPVLILMVASPAYFPTMLLGQTSLLWMACLLAALAALRAERWIVAGVLIGCLTLKPQLGLMIPFALLGLGAWRTILAAVATTALLVVAPTLIYGMEYWTLLEAGLAEHSDRMLFSYANIKLMVSPLYTLCFYGIPADVALSLQWIITAAMTLVVAWFWRSDTANFDIKAAVLLIAILLTAPYLWYYEAALLAGVALFLVRGGVLTMRPGHMLIVFLLWIGCGLQAINFVFEVFHQGWLGAAYISPLLFFCLGMCTKMVLSTRRNVAVID